MLIGDQTQSNLLRVSLQKVGDVEQGSVMPFFEGLESGVMRPVFLPDGSLLLGQTGRGWQAKGGKVAALQHVTWDGKTVAPQIVAMIATPQGFRIDLTQPLGDGVSAEILQLGVVAGILDVSRCAGLRLAGARSARRSDQALTIERGSQEHRRQAGVDRAEGRASAADRARVSR